MTGAPTWPVDPAVLPGFLLAMVLIELTPGPNMGYLAVIAAGRGRLAGVLSVMGITAGLGVYLVLAVFGLTHGLTDAPVAMTALRWGGVLYLFVLAAEALRPSTGSIATNGGAGRLVARGLLANLLNPKALLFYGVLLPGFVRPDHAAPWVQLLSLGLAHIAISVLIHLGIVLGAARTTATWGAGRRRMLRFISAAGLAAVALWLALAN